MGRVREDDEREDHQEHDRRNAVDKAVEDVHHAVGQRVAVAAEHVDRKAEQRAERDGAQGDEQRGADALGEELPAVFLDEGLVEAVFNAVHEMDAVLGDPLQHEHDVAAVIRIRQHGGFRALFVHDDVHAEVVFARDDGRRDGVEFHGVEFAVVAVFRREVQHELHVVAGEFAVALEGEGLVAAFDGDAYGAVLAGGLGDRFDDAGVGIPVDDPVVIQLVQPAVLPALGDEFLEFGKQSALLVVVAHDDGEIRNAYGLFQPHQLRMFEALGVETDFFDQVGGDLVGFQRRDHVVGHLVVVPGLAFQVVLDVVLVEHAGLDAQVLAVQFFDGRDAALGRRLLREDGDRGAEEDEDLAKMAEKMRKTKSYGG